MITAYLRTVRVNVTGNNNISFDNLKIDFRIARAIHSQSPLSTVSIYNLSKNTIRIFENIKGSMELLAGYQNKLSSLFNGQIFEVETEKRGVDKITKFTLTQNKSQEIETFFIMSYGPSTPLKTIVKDIVNSMNLNLGSLSIIPNTNKEYYAYSGKSSEALTKLLNFYRISWYIDDGFVRFSKVGAVNQLNTFIISPSTGLISSANRTDDGILFSTVLMPNILLNHRVILDSENVKGNFKIVAIAHKGSNYNGEFVSEFKAVNIV